MYYSSQRSTSMGPGGITPGVKFVLIATVAVYVLQLLFPDLPAYFVLRPYDHPDFMIWQPVTYMFIHAGMPFIFHILFNMFALWMFGVAYEREFGQKKFLLLYFSSGIFAGLVYTFFIDFNGLIGASAGVYGILVSFAYFWPNSLIFIFGIIPVRAKYLVIGLMVFGLLSSMNDTGDNTAHFAHILGASFGFIFLQLVHRRYNFIASLGRKIGEKKDNIKYSMNVKKQEKIIDKEEWTNERINLLLDKVSKHGLASLTKSEKEFLDRASKGYR